MLKFYEICKHEKIEKLTSAHHGSLVKEVFKVINEDQYSSAIPYNCHEIDFRKFETGNDVPVQWRLPEIKKIAVLINDNSSLRTTVIVQKFKIIIDAFNDMYCVFRSDFQEEKIDKKKKEEKKCEEKNIDEEESDVDNDDISGVTEYSAGIFIGFCSLLNTNLTFLV